MRPRIAISAELDHLEGKDRLHVPVRYAHAVVAAGGAPVVLPPVSDESLLAELLAQADGLLLVGGGDLDPALWGEPRHPQTHPVHPHRQKSDFVLLAAAESQGLPVLGICLGCQVIAVHRGGSVTQHIYDEPTTSLDHGGPGRPSADHTVTIDPASLLARIVGPEKLRVNSTHHQAVRDPGRGMRAVARSDDAVIEAIESQDPDRFLLGVQWHPERLCWEARHLAIFQAFCERAGARHAARPPS